MTESDDKPVIAPVDDREQPWRSLQPIVDAELEWGNTLSHDWTYYPREEHWYAKLGSELHVDRLRERFDFDDRIVMSHQLAGWLVTDVTANAVLESRDVGVVLAPGGRAVDRTLIGRALSWADRRAHKDYLP